MTSAQLKRAAAIKDKIDQLNKELQSLLGGSASRSTSRRRRTMSAAVRKKIAAAQRKRWAKVKRAK